MAQVNIRMDDALKEQGEKLFNALGMNLSTAFTVFVSQAVREGGIPFEVTTRPDPFYSEANMAALRRSLQELNEGKVVSKTFEELQSMEQ